MIALAERDAAKAIAEFRAADEGACVICPLPGLGQAYDLAGQQDSALAVYQRYAGTILERTAFDNGVIVKLRAIYRVTDPSGSHSFAALIEGTQNLVTLAAVLNGVVTEGWMVGAQVHVTFQRIAPCALAIGPSAPGVCFQGTIRIQG